VDKTVWELERHALGRCSDSLVVVANKGIFGDRVFSMRGSAIARLVGTKRIDPYHIQIARPKGTVLFPDGVRRNGVTDSYMPKSLTDEFHPGGNSLCYTIQLAHLMGCDPIYALAFTLKPGSGYQWGTNINPVTRRASMYDVRRALEWLSWYQQQWPGRVQLVEGWSGPVYGVFSKVGCDELRERLEPASTGPTEPNSEPNGGRDSEVQRLRSDHGDQPVHWLL
jgi:hypothetical protein